MLVTRLPLHSHIEVTKLCVCVCVISILKCELKCELLIHKRKGVYPLQKNKFALKALMPYSYDVAPMRYFGILWRNHQKYKILLPQPLLPQEYWLVFHTLGTTYPWAENKTQITKHFSCITGAWHSILWKCTAASVEDCCRWFLNVAAGTFSHIAFTKMTLVTVESSSSAFSSSKVFFALHHQPF